ncbi:MAG: hypothetical protein NW226_04540 [Microscillaceae bacterium]|nr:hypothetical protein [Microscillaceae bacterium]
MDKLVKEKIKKAIDQSEQKKLKNHTEFICPLRSWDIFAMLKEDYKNKKDKMR